VSGYHIAEVRTLLSADEVCDALLERHPAADPPGRQLAQEWHLATAAFGEIAERP
jgi:hypothetical protein